MRISRLIRITQAACLWILGIASVASANGLANSGIYVPWAAITAVVAVIGILGTLVGLVRRGDLTRIDERFEEQKEQRAEIIGWLQRVEKKIDDLIKEL